MQAIADLLGSFAKHWGPQSLPLGPSVLRVSLGRYADHPWAGMQTTSRFTYLIDSGHYVKHFWNSTWFLSNQLLH